MTKEFKQGLATLGLFIFSLGVGVIYSMITVDHSAWNQVTGGVFSSITIAIGSLSLFYGARTEPAIVTNDDS